MTQVKEGKIVRFGVFTQQGRCHRVGMRWYKNPAAAIETAKRLYAHYPKRKLCVEEWAFQIAEGRVVNKTYARKTWQLEAASLKED